MPKFLNPLIDEYVEQDDPEYGLHTLEDVDLERSFPPEVLELVRQSLEQEQPEENQVAIAAISKLRPEGGRLNPRALDQLKKLQSNEMGNLTDEDIQPDSQKLEAFTNRSLDKKSVPFLGVQEKESEPSKIGQGFENRPSMKPIWNKREENKRDLVNIEALKKFLSGK